MARASARRRSEPAPWRWRFLRPASRCAGRACGPAFARCIQGAGTWPPKSPSPGRAGAPWRSAGPRSQGWRIATGQPRRSPGCVPTPRTLLCAAVQQAPNSRHAACSRSAQRSSAYPLPMLPRLISTPAPAEPYRPLLRVELDVLHADALQRVLPLGRRRHPARRAEEAPRLDQRPGRDVERPSVSDVIRCAMPAARTAALDGDRLPAAPAIEFRLPRCRRGRRSAGIRAASIKSNALRQLRRGRACRRGA